MDADLKTLQDYKSNLFEIPQFQRTYAWRERDWESFWTTLAEAAINIEFGNTGQFIPPIFMGAVVLQELPAQRINGSQVSKYAIIDGQQRLVTLAVFAAVLRDFYFGQGSDLWERVSERFLSISTSLDSKNTQVKLKLQEKDQAAYEQIVAKKDQSEWKKCYEGKHPLNQLYKFFWSKLSMSILEHFEQVSEADSVEFDKESETSPLDSKPKKKFLEFLPKGLNRDSKGEELFNPNDLADLLDKHIKLAVIEIGTEDNEIAFEVFDTLNAKGVELKEVDKFKNGYFMLLPSDSTEIYEKYWLPIEQGSSKYQYLSLEQFFHEETIRRFGWTPSDKTYQRLMTHIKQLARTASSESGRIDQEIYRKTVVEQLNQIKHSFVAYDIVKTGSDLNIGKDAQSKRYANYLQFFKRLGVVPLTPILMDLIKLTEGHRGDREILRELLSCFHSLQSFVVRRVLAGVPPQQLRSSISSIPKELAKHTKKCDVDSLKQYRINLEKILINKGTDKFPNDDTLLSDVTRDLYNRTGKKESLFVVMWELQRQLNKEDEANLIPAYGTAEDAFSIEHVLPQGTKKNEKQQYVMDQDWRQLWDAWEVVNPESQFISTVHSIGNLTLLQNPVNSMAGNNTFENKKKIYRDNTRLKLSDTIVSANKWTPEEIADRSKMLLELAIARWPYPKVD